MVDAQDFREAELRDCMPGEGTPEHVELFDDARHELALYGETPERILNKMAEICLSCANLENCQLDAELIADGYFAKTMEEGDDGVFPIFLGARLLRQLEEGNSDVTITEVAVKSPKPTNEATLSAQSLNSGFVRNVGLYLSQEKTVPFQAPKELDEQLVPERSPRWPNAISEFISNKVKERSDVDPAKNRSPFVSFKELVVAVQSTYPHMPPKEVISEVNFAIHYLTTITEPIDGKNPKNGVTNPYVRASVERAPYKDAQGRRVYPFVEVIGYKKPKEVLLREAARRLQSFTMLDRAPRLIYPPLSEEQDKELSRVLARYGVETIKAAGAVTGIKHTDRLEAVVNFDTDAPLPLVWTVATLAKADPEVGMSIFEIYKEITGRINANATDPEAEHFNKVVSSLITKSLNKGLIQRANKKGTPRYSIKKLNEIDD